MTSSELSVVFDLLVNKFPIIGMLPKIGNFVFVFASVFDNTPESIRVCPSLTLTPPVSNLLTLKIFIGPQLGIEIVSNASKGMEIWEYLISKDIQPIGLAARDTLRLEAGFNLYGSDMTIKNTPYDSNLEWTVDHGDEHRDYVGKKALNDQKESKQCLVGFYTKERGVLRSGTKVYFDGGEGEITSGTWSPTFKKNIGFCRIAKNYPKTGKSILRDKEINLHFCKTNFLKYLK